MAQGKDEKDPLEIGNEVRRKAGAREIDTAKKIMVHTGSDPALLRAIKMDEWIFRKVQDGG